MEDNITFNIAKLAGIIRKDKMKILSIEQYKLF